MKKIFMFSSVHRWNDTRVFWKEAISLAKKYELELHIPADFKFRELYNVKIYGLPRWKKVSERKKIRKEIFERIKKSKADIYHFHDPELIFIGLYIKFFMKKKVIYDIHENVARQILNKEYIPKYLRKLVSITYAILEIVVIRNFDGIIVAGEDILPNYSAKIVINNYPILSSKKRLPFYKKDNSIIYLGGITKIRGVENIVKALVFIKKKYGKIIKLKLVGKFDDKNYETFLLEKYSNFIDFRGWLTQKEAYEETNKSRIGMVLYLPYPNHYFLRSNKVFEYMECGIPVIYSNFPDWKEKLDNLKVGLSVDPQNISKIAKKIMKIYFDEDMQNQMGKEGKVAINTKFNWSVEEKKIIEYYETII